MTIKPFLPGAFLCLAALSPATAAGDAYLDRAREIHKKIIVFDSHLDIPDDFGTPGLEAGTDGATQFDLPKVERGLVKGASLAVFVPQGPRTPQATEEARAAALKKYQIIVGIAAKYPERAGIAYTPTDVRKLAEQGKFAIVVSILNGYPLGGDVSKLDEWYGRGVRIFGFTHAGNNDLADSSRPALLEGDKLDEHGGLSEAGKKFVARLNELGVLIDVSQLSSNALRDVLSLTKAPVAATHSGVRGLVDHPRNLSDAELQAIKKNGGVVQLTAYSSWVRPLPEEWQQKVNAVRREFGVPEEYPIASIAPVNADGVKPLSKEKYEEYSRRAHAVLLDPSVLATVSQFVDGIDYAVKRIGVDHVGISSDFNHGGGVIGWNNEGEAPNVTAELLRRGYTEEQIRKIWGENFLRVWQSAQKAGKEK
jgi:microsomal dipeptidase-like Zn-dependent dipeptidase